MTGRCPADASPSASETPTVRSSFMPDSVSAAHSSVDYSLPSAQRIPAKEVRALSNRSDLHGFLKVASHLLAIAASTTGLSLSWGTWFFLPVFCIQGVLLACLYAGVHELSHYTVFKTSALNAFFGHLFGFIILVPRDADRFEHFEHHRHTQNPQLDAEIVGRKPFTFGSYLLYWFGLTYWKDRLAEVIINASGRAPAPYLPPRMQRHVIWEARLYLLGYAAVAGVSIHFGSFAILKLWIGPLMAMKFFHQMQNIIEHTGMPFVEDIRRNTRTVRTNVLMRWLNWNMQYHTAHHLHPGVPFFRLPELHAQLLKHMDTEPETLSYLQFQKHMLRKLRREGSSHYAGAPIASY